MPPSMHAQTQYISNRYRANKAIGCVMKVAFRQTVSSLMLSSVNEMGTAKTSRSDSLRFYLLTVTLLKQQQLHGHSAPLKYIGPLLGRSRHLPPSIAFASSGS